MVEELKDEPTGQPVGQEDPEPRQGRRMRSVRVVTGHHPPECRQPQQSHEEQIYNRRKVCGAQPGAVQAGGAGLQGHLAEKQGVDLVEGVEEPQGPRHRKRPRAGNVHGDVARGEPVDMLRAPHRQDEKHHCPHAQADAHKGPQELKGVGEAVLHIDPALVPLQKVAFLRAERRPHREA